MRFSSIFFQLPLPARTTGGLSAAARPEDAAVPLAVAIDPPDSAMAGLPEALDERVRLVGEWQLGES